MKGAFCFWPTKRCVGGRQSGPIVVPQSPSTLSLRVCVCLWMGEREREREKESGGGELTILRAEQTTPILLAPMTLNDYSRQTHTYCKLIDLQLARLLIMPRPCAVDGETPVRTGRWTFLCVLKLRSHLYICWLVVGRSQNRGRLPSVNFSDWSDKLMRKIADPVFLKMWITLKITVWLNWSIKGLVS
jgi:hypothetical protein